jgi:hypothetical protein
LGDVGGVIANSLQMFRDQNQPEGTGDELGVFNHEAEEFSEDLLVHIINPPIVVDDPFGQNIVAIHKCIHAMRNNRSRRFGHDRQHGWNATAWTALQTLQDSSGDVHRQTAHTFNVPDNLKCRDHETQIAGHRMVQGEDLFA